MRLTINPRSVQDVARVREILERLPPAERSAWLADLRARYKPKRNFIAGLP